MRVSREVMSRHHDEIITTASRMLRERGIDGLSVADLMQAAGRTHGGFYRHFASKDALVAEATAATFKTTVRMLEERASRKGAGPALAEYVADYLSTGHVDNPGFGCPIAAYGADVARQGDTVRAAYAEGLTVLIDWIAGCLDGSAPQARSRARAILTTMVGAIVTVRGAGNNSLTRDALGSARKQVEQIIAAG